MRQIDIIPTTISSFLSDSPSSRKEGKKGREEIQRLSNKGFILGFVKPATDKKWCKGGSSQTLSSPVFGLDISISNFIRFVSSFFICISSPLWV